MIRVLVAEDMHMIRGALVALLSAEADLEVVAELAEGTAIVPRAREVVPDVAVLDVDLPGRDGLSVAAELRTVLPGCRILVLTGLGQAAVVRRALDADVHGFVLKDAPPARLAAAIREVAVGRRVVADELARAADDADRCPLAARELEVLRLVGRGDTVDDVAGTLHLSAGTVRNYLTSAVGKLDARSRVDAVRIAAEQGWI
ncbi:response regulator transcription factor [Actinomycetospora sp. OC33-EN08]|uniref:Response regulator transcription factor n=1 Tax=Actinomycetospora aurantiaca TaxID=3129233 RepID=A0ABU8MPY2_9PSEU